MPTLAAGTPPKLVQRPKTAAERRARVGKILEALDSIPQSLVPKGSLGYLVDEEYGAAAARRASERGIYLAMPIEASRTPILRHEGSTFRAAAERPCARSCDRTTRRFLPSRAFPRRRD